MVIKGKLWDFWFRGFGYFFRSVFWFCAKKLWFLNFGFHCSLWIFYFLAFGFQFSQKNINWFSDLISNVVFGFSHLTFLGSGLSSI